MTLIVHTISAVIVALLLLIRVNAAKDTYRLGVLIPVEGYLDLSAYIPTLELALETVDNDTTLPFNFTYTFNDSMVRKSVVRSVVLHVALPRSCI